MTPSITACPPTSVSSPLSRTGINCMCAARRKNPLGDTVWILLLLVYDKWVGGPGPCRATQTYRNSRPTGARYAQPGPRLPVFENERLRLLYALDRIAFPFVLD